MLNCSPWPGLWKPEKWGVCVYTYVCVHVYTYAYTYTYTYIQGLFQKVQIVSLHVLCQEQGRQLPAPESSVVRKSSSVCAFCLTHTLACCQS